MILRTIGSFLVFLVPVFCLFQHIKSGEKPRAGTGQPRASWVLVQPTAPGLVVPGTSGYPVVVTPLYRSCTAVESPAPGVGSKPNSPASLTARHRYYPVVSHCTVGAPLYRSCTAVGSLAPGVGYSSASLTRRAAGVSRRCPAVLRIAGVIRRCPAVRHTTGITRRYPSDAVCRWYYPAVHRHIALVRWLVCRRRGLV